MPIARNITEFFRPFRIAKAKRVVDSDEAIFDNIVVADHRSRGSSNDSRTSAETRTIRLQSHTIVKVDLEPPQPTSKSRDIATDVAISSSGLSSISSATPSAPPTPLRSNVRLPPPLSPPSPASSRSSSPPVPEQQLDGQSGSQEKAPVNKNISFTSGSTLSSLPISSQTSSKRVIREGMLAVTNSDSDSVSHDSDELDDIDELIRRKRLKLTTPGPETPTTLETKRELRSTKREPSARSARKAMSPSRKTYKHGLASLVRQAQMEAALDVKMQSYENEYSQDLDQEKRAKDRAAAGELEVDKFAERLQDEAGDSDEKEGVLRAMRRMDALHKDVVYNFFREPDPGFERHEFPTKSTRNTGWAKILDGQAQREQAFTSGFVADMVSTIGLPLGVEQWLLSELPFESREDLGYAYVHVLSITVSRRYKDCALAAWPLLRLLLLQSGQGDLALARIDNEKARPAANDKRVGTIPVGLRWSIQLYRKMGGMSLEESRNWLAMLMLMLADTNIGKDVSVTNEIQQSLADLFEEQVSPEAWNSFFKPAGNTVLDRLPNPQLLAQLLSRLPSYSPACHILKRRLALSHFLKDRAYLTSTLTDPAIITTITTYIRRSSKFKITEKTDFSILGARFAILDIAIGAGFSDFSFLPDASDTTYTKSSKKQREDEFNAGIDSLVKELRQLSSNIRDAGAAHMRRTECKGVVEGLAVRLQFAVRTRAKARKGIFGANGQEGEGGLWKGFLQREDVAEAGAGAGAGAESSG